MEDQIETISRKVDPTNLGNLLAAQHLHYLMIAIFFSLAIYLWNREKNLFSFNWKKWVSYFFLISALGQFTTRSFSSWTQGIEKRTSIFQYFGALIHPGIFTKESFENIDHSSFGMVLWCWWVITWMATTSLYLGFALWSPKVPLNKFSIKRVFSILFFIMASTHFICNICSFFGRAMYTCLESFHST